MGWFSFFISVFLFSQSSFAFGKHDYSSRSEQELWASLHEQFLLGEELVAGFDRLVLQGETVPSLVRDGARFDEVYAKLQVLRGMNEELTAELESRLMLSFFIEESSSAQSGMESWIRTRAEVFRKKLRVRDPSYAFSMGPLIAFAKSFDRERGFGLESLSGPVVLEEYRQWRDGFRRRGARVRGLSSLRSRIEAGAGEIREGWAEGLQTEPARLDPDLQIFPSTASSGNITGSGFPQGNWSLTFDDGPGFHTRDVLENLKSHGIKASFFVLTSQLEKSSELASFAIQAVQDGHDVFSHSYQHLQIPKLSQESQKHEIEGALQGFEAVLGFRPDLFRLPYGAGVNHPVVRGNLVKSCQVHVFWNVDTLDWQDRDPASIFDRAVKQMKSLGRGVILFHDIHWQSAVASEKLMSYLKSGELNTILLSDFVRNRNGGVRWGCKPGWDSKVD